MLIILIPSFIYNNNLYVWLARKKNINQTIFPIQNTGQLIYIHTHSSNLNIDNVVKAFNKNTKINIYDYPGQFEIYLPYSDENFAIYIMMINKTEENGFFTYNSNDYQKAGWVNINHVYELMQYDNLKDYVYSFLYNNLFYNYDHVIRNKIIYSIKKYYSKYSDAIYNILNRKDSNNVNKLIHLISNQKTDNIYYIAATLYLYHNKQIIYDKCKFKAVMPKKNIIKKTKIINESLDSW